MAVILHQIPRFRLAFLSVEEHSFLMKFSLDQTKEQIINNILVAGDAQQRVGIALLNFKLQEELQRNQEGYNAKQLWWSRALAIGTWALVGATLLLIKNA